MAVYLWIRRAHGSTMCLEVLLTCWRSYRREQTATDITTTDVRRPSGRRSPHVSTIEWHGLVPAELRELRHFIGVPLRVRRGFARSVHTKHVRPVSARERGRFRGLLFFIIILEEEPGRPVEGRARVLRHDAIDGVGQHTRSRVSGERYVAVRGLHSH